MEMIKKKVKLYPRVSGKEQADKGDSVEYQEKRLIDDSEKNDEDIVGIYTDAGKSASLSEDKIKIWHRDGFVYAKIDISKRIGMIEILDSLNDNDWEILKVTKWDRFSRNNIFSLLMFQYFKENNKKIFAVDDSNDTLVRNLMSVLGEQEIQKLTGRIRDVRQMRFEKGIFPARSPFGYKPIIENKKVIGFEIDDKEAEIIKKCFSMALNGRTYKEICDATNLKPQQYYNIIRNRALCGYVTFQGEERKGIHKPIISEAIWNKANENFK